MPLISELYIANRYNNTTENNAIWFRLEYLDIIIMIIMINPPQNNDVNLAKSGTICTINLLYDIPKTYKLNNILYLGLYKKYFFL